MPTIIPLFFDTYLTVIKNSRGAKTYRDSFALVDGKKKNITKNGALSCAFFVSSLLRSFALLHELHTTVSGTLRDMEKSGWVKIKKPRAGCIIHWEAKKGVNGLHEHLGFCIDATHAISTSSRTRTPEVHPIHYRRILALYSHQKLNA